MNARICRLSVGQVLLVVAMFASGASGQTPSGFLSDYSRLSPAFDNPDTSIWISKDFNFRPYRKILLDKVEIFVSPTGEYHGVTPDVLKGMADRFTASFKKALQPGYQLVDKPGPDVLRIRPALSGINLVRPGFNIANVLPVVFVARSGDRSQSDYERGAYRGAGSARAGRQRGRSINGDRNRGREGAAGSGDHMARSRADNRQVGPGSSASAR